MAGAVTALLGLAPVTWPAPMQDVGLLDSFALIADTIQNISECIDENLHGTSPLVELNPDKTELLSVYPNPSYGTLIIKSSVAGKFVLYTLPGQKIQQYSILPGETNIQLPPGLAAGIYVGEFKPDSGSVRQEIRLVYQP